MTEPWIQLSECLWELREQWSDGESPYEPGFYFTDERDEFNGPFPKQLDAERAFQQYMESL